MFLTPQHFQALRRTSNWGSLICGFWLVVFDIASGSDHAFGCSGPVVRDQNKSNMLQSTTRSLGQNCFCYAFVCVCLLMPCGHLLGWLSFVMSNCEVVTFPLVSWVRCGAWLYRFLIFALFYFDAVSVCSNAIFAPCDILAPHISYNNYLDSNPDTIRLLFLLNVPNCLIILIRYRPSLLQEYHCYWFSLLFGHILPERVKYKVWLFKSKHIRTSGMFILLNITKFAL